MKRDKILEYNNIYSCPLNIIQERAQERSDTICGFSPNCYLCLRHKKQIKWAVIMAVKGT